MLVKLIFLGSMQAEDECRRECDSGQECEQGDKGKGFPTHPLFITV